ncbi:MAG TPA: methylated-DNA--[protein]-cysteine S-methyltransferase [Candidatus Anaerobiospirillum pullistercoris]|uniref:methylated-DNA--[protein]-cysteine S-methyltransferase n=1 Tax=Candidatus Anaerobiospirillum pullistercoris TaxID=2838452 RepID=A0A9D1WDR0_9GAMM|nr:methylated-DNA--[protein]-cysteine S-methyltransferase [Candidatus Anaerobiospirillum pullistercoris]
MVQQFLAQDAAQSSDPILQTTVNWLRCYFVSGHEVTLPALPPLYLLGTPFQQAVWQELLRVPYGQTISYAQLTAQVVQRLQLPPSYKGYRGVAQAVGHNPVSILVPCHRIIGSNGKLTGYAGGLERKEFLLHLEGAW